MSELKVYHCNEWHNEYTEFYIKSEADKVIADQKNKIEVLQKEKKIIQDLYIGERNDCRIWAARAIHNKYKRCLALAKWCRSRACFYDTMREGSLYWAWKSDRAYKWHKRWFAIAEKFKTNSTAQQGKE